MLNLTHNRTLVNILPLFTEIEKKIFVLVHTHEVIQTKRQSLDEIETH